MEPLQLSIHINQSAQHVWEVLTNPSLWWDDVQLEPRVGGIFEELWDGNVTRGTVLEITAPTKLKLSWKDADWPADTYVTFTLVAEGQTTLVTLEHEGWDIFAAPIAAELRTAHEAGWRSHLEDLKQAAETA